MLFHRPRSGGEIDAARRIYITLPHSLHGHPEATQAWDRVLGQTVIFFTGGLTNPRGVVFVPYPVTVHVLPLVNNWRDGLPVPYELLPTVLEHAQRLQLVPVEKP